MPSAGCAVISVEAAPTERSGGILGGNGHGRMKKWKEGGGAKLSGGHCGIEMITCAVKRRESRALAHQPRWNYFGS